MRHVGMFDSLRAMVLPAGLLALAVGCSSVHTGGRSLLSPPVMPGDSITVEKYSVRFNHGDEDLNDKMWAEIDEECLPSDLRARLAANGFRAGVVGAHLPAALEHVLHDAADAPKVAPPSAPAHQQADGTPGLYEPKPIDLLHDPKVRRGLWQTRPGNPGIIVTAGEQARIPSIAVLVRGDDGRVTGRCYERVLGALSMKVFSERDGRVRLEMIPEIEHGDLRSRFVADQGMFKPDYRPESVVFKELRLETILSPGEMLVLACRADKPGTLGYHFFTEQGPGQPLEQKMLLIRLAQAPAAGGFRAGEIPPSNP